MYRVSVISQTSVFAVEMNGEYAEMMEEIVALMDDGRPVILVHGLVDLEDLGIELSVVTVVEPEADEEANNEMADEENELEEIVELTDPEPDEILAEDYDQHSPN